MPLQTATNPMDTIQLNQDNKNNNNEFGGERIEDIRDDKIKRKRTKKKKKKKRLSRNDKFRQYVKEDVKWWLFIGFMLSLFIFSFCAINVGIAEDIVLFYANYTDLVCHYFLDGTQTEQRLIGDVLNHQTIQNFFTSAAGACIVGLFGIIISSILIFSKQCAKNARHSILVAISHFVIFSVGLLVLFVWNIMLCLQIIDELKGFLNGLSHCNDEEIDIVKEEDSAKDEANRLLNEFEIIAVMILPLIFVIVCTVWYCKIKIAI